MAAIDLSAAPFNLDDEAVAWVHETRDKLSARDKLAQLFVLLSRGPADEALESIRAFKPGGITRIFSPNLADEIALMRQIDTAGPVPMTVSADLEGSRMSLPFGTEVPNPLGLAAVDDVEATTAISTLMAEEARAVGLNWSFTPVIDINKAFQSAIVGTRSYGDDVDRIERHALAPSRANSAEGALEGGAVDVGHGHVDALAGQRHRNCAAEPATRAEHESGLCRQAEIHRFLPRSGRCSVV